MLLINKLCNYDIDLVTTNQYSENQKVAFSNLYRIDTQRIKTSSEIEIENKSIIYNLLTIFS